MSGPTLASGDRVLLHDRMGRHYAIRLEPGGRSSLHTGFLSHDDLIGRPDGSIIATSGGSRLLALRPTFAERVVSRRRQAQPIYPKDLGAILIDGDIFPGARVLEAGTGTGALALALARAAGYEGRVVSYEIRADFHAGAQEAISEAAGGLPGNLELRLGDVREAEGSFDRVCLDLPEAWSVVDRVAAVLVPGGVLFAHCPNLSQVQRLAEALREQTGFGLIATKELMQRGWVVRERSLRPMHRMVGHTGFLVFGRRIADGATFDTESEGFR